MATMKSGIQTENSHFIFLEKAKDIWIENLWRSNFAIFVWRFFLFPAPKLDSATLSIFTTSYLFLNWFS